MNIVTGCSGIDAIAYAALLLGMELKGQIEIDTFCNTILELRYPGVKRYKNIFDVRGDEFGAVDIFAAGIPCQPFSHAGKREGTEDDRYLWPEAIRIIQFMQPTWVIIENVDGIGSMEQSNSETIVETETEICQDAEMVLETIRKDLEETRYTSIAIILPACSVEAPHQRYRYYILAHNDSCGYLDGGTEEQPTERGQQAQSESIKCNSTMGNSECSGCSGEPRRRTDTESEDGYSRVEVMAHSDSGRCEQCNQTEWSISEPDKKCNYVADTECQRQQGQGESIQSGNTTQDREWQASGTEHVCVESVGAAQSGMGRNADGLPNRVYRSGGQEDSSGVLGAFEEIFTTLIDQTLWPAGYGAEQYDYEPPRVATGVKNRTNRLKALGNAIVWQQIFPILLAIKLISLMYVR